MKLSRVVQILVLTLALGAYSTWANHSRAGIPLIRLKEAAKLWRESTTVFLDVRPSTDYEFGHIPGALHLPYEDFEEGFPALEARLRRAHDIVVYCKSEDCGASLWMALRLRNAGLAQTKIFPEGWNEWYLGKLPTTIRAQ